ncbi:MAG TPA: AI-2E family transporter [Chloroflexota bacterium]|nr:AI-2E family transporter [Chloroflexota bacterium]
MQSEARPTAEDGVVEEVDAAAQAARAAWQASPRDWAKTRDILLCVVLAFLIVSALGFAASHVTRVILIVIAAALVAFIASPIVTRMERMMPRWLAALIVYLAFLGLLAGAGTWLGSRVVPQVQELVKNLPSEMARLQDFLAGKEQQIGHPGLITDQITSFEQNFGMGGGNGSAPGAALNGASLGTAVGFATRLTDVLANIVVVLVVGYYFLLDGARIWSGARAIVPRRHSPKLAFLELQLNRVIGGYIRGQLTLALIIGLSVGIGMLVLGVRYPAVLGVAGFFFELIPMIGPVMTGVLCLIVAAFQGFPLVLWVLIFYIVLQFVEANVLGPRISGHAVGLHPAASILALVVGADLFGLWGALVAVPLAGLAVVLATALIRQLRGERVDGLVEPRKPWRRRQAASAGS